MFLIERLFGIGVYMLLLVIACWLLTKTTARAQSVLKYYLLALCVMAAFYVPYYTGDLYRMYILMDFFADMTFVQFWRDYVVLASSPASRLLMWCISKTGMYALLPMLSAFVCYSVLFYTILKVQWAFDISKRNLAYVLFFIMSTSLYLSVIGGVRMMIAFSLLFYCFYRVAVEKKLHVFDLLVAIVAILFHTTALVIITVCVAVIIFNSRRHLAWRFAWAALLFSFAAALVVMFPGIVPEFFEKISDYVWGDRFSDKWEYLMGALILLLLLLLFIEYRKLDAAARPQSLRPMNIVAMVCILISLGFFFEFSIFYRFGGHFAVIFAIPTLMVTLERSGGQASHLVRRIDFKSILLTVSLLIALISCSRGSLSSLKFFEL